MSLDIVLSLLSFVDDLGRLMIGLRIIVVPSIVEKCYMIEVSMRIVGGYLLMRLLSVCEEINPQQLLCQRPKSPFALYRIQVWNI